MKKMFSTLMVMFFMAILGGAFGSCESNEVNTASDSSEVRVPLNWTFKYDTSRVNGKFVVSYTITESTVGFTETGKEYFYCDHERDGYAGPREASLQYSIANTSQGNVKTVQKSATPEKEVYIDSIKTTSLTECGNVINCWRVQERIVLIINGKRYELPYIKIGTPALEKLELLPGTAKTRAEEEVITDSVCRAPGWKATCEIANYAKDASKFDVRLNDLFKVYQLEPNEVKSAKITGDDRVPINDTEERCDIFVDLTKVDGTVHSSTISKILKRSITTKPRWEVFVQEFGFKWQSDKAIVTGAEAKAESDENWTVYGRTDLFGAIIANGGDPNIETEYQLYHQRATYKDEKLGLSHSFDYVSFNPAEKSTTEEDVPSSRDGYDAKHLVNTIATSYLGYSQDAKEDVILFKKAEEEKPTFDGWDEVSSYRIDEDDQTIWHTEYYYEKGDDSERFIFDWVQPRVLEYLGPWSSIEASNKWETSATSSELAGSEPVEQEQKGAKARWKVVTYNLQSTVSLAGSKQYDRWRSKEGDEFSVEFRGKTLKLSGGNYSVNNKANLADAGMNGDYHEWNHTNVLTYKWGNNTKNSTATGLVKVAETKGDSYFFPPEWGGVKGARQTVINNKGHDGWGYCWSIQFGNGVLPVIVPSGATTVTFKFELFEYTDVKDYNSATYVIKDDNWVNTVATDRSSQMTWERNGKEYANKDYTEAGRQNWDTGHKVDGHPSVHTSRYDLKVENGYLSATDTYDGTYFGSWK